MSSDRPTDPNELHRLLSQYQQLFASASQRHQPATGLLRALAATAATSPPTVPQGLELIGDGVRTNNTPLAASSRGARENAAQGLSAFLSQVQLQRQLEAPRPPSPTGNVIGDLFDQLIPPPAHLFSAFPGLNAAAIARALTSSHEQQVQQQVQHRQQQVQRQQHSQLNQFQISLGSLYQKLQHQVSNPSSLPAQSEGVCNLGSPAGDNLDASQSHLRCSDTSNQDASSTVKETTTLPISLHGLDSDMPSDGSAPSRSTASPPVYLSARHWSLEELESHVKQLQDSNQAIPQSIAILLASARRKQEKLNAKKLANRKSALSSRARKKAKIDAMAEENVRLKREVSILSSIPDPVVAIDIDGVITFCSRQMERVVLHKAADLIGENIEKLIVPDSMVALRTMIEDVVANEKRAPPKEDGDIARASYVRASSDGFDSEGNSGINSSRSDHCTVSTKSSEQSFPMLEVKVDSCEDISHSSSYRSNKKKGTERADRPISASSASDDYPKTNGNHEDNNVKPSHEESQRDQQLHFCPQQNRVLKSRCSSLSLAEKQEYSSSMTSDSSLSKAEYRPSASNLSEDSGVRESNGSQSNKSSSSSMNNTDKDYLNPPKEVKRTAPLAPACHVRLIRDDLSTIWCELTSSVTTLRAKKLDQKSATNMLSVAKDVVESKIFEEETQELLLCFRPIVEGEKAGEELRFHKTIHKLEDPTLSGDAERDGSSSSGSSKTSTLPKKRKFISDKEDTSEARMCQENTREGNKERRRQDSV